MDDKTKLPAPIGTSTSLEGMSKDVAYLRRDVDEMKINHEKYHKELMEEIRNQSASFATKGDILEVSKISEDHERRIRVMEEDHPDMKIVKKLVYGFVVLVLVAVVTALIYLVVQK